MSQCKEKALQAVARSEGLKVTRWAWKRTEPEEAQRWTT